MRAWGALVALAGCYDAPVSGPPCTIACTDSCPGDLMCVNGYCVGDGDVCDPAFAQVSAGAGFACALDVRGLLWCWGDNAHHQLTADATPQLVLATRIGDTTWQQISAGGGHTCGITTDGALQCWGANDRGQVSGTVIGDVTAPLAIDAPGAPGRWTSVTAGENATCATGDDGSLWCWGAGDRGQLGTGATVDVGVPTQVAQQYDNITAVALGWAPNAGHACAISATSGLVCWGANDNGELGDGTTTSALAPVQVALPAAPTAVSAMATSTCATTADTKLWCWGRGDLGQLGDPGLVTSSQLLPVPASGLDGWTAVASAEQLTCAQRDDELWCWGAVQSGNGVGNGVWGATRGFGKIATGVAALSVGESTILDDVGTDIGDLDLVCALSAGRVLCFGDNRFGQLAQGAPSMAPVPAEIAGAHHWSALAIGAAHACGLDGDQLYCWGSTQSGQANGTVSGNANSPCGVNPDVACDVWTPELVDAVAHARSVALGVAHTCALGDTLACWGNDDVGQLGAFSLPATPIAVPGAWTELFETHGNAVCAAAGSEVSCWGSMQGALAMPTRIADLDGALTIGVSASIGSSAGFGCFLDAAGALACVGANALGQYGDGASGFCGDGVCNNNETAASCNIGECGTDPVTRLGRTYSALSVGWGGNTSGGVACAITGAGGVECWGRNRGAMVTATNDPTTMRPPDYVFEPTPIAGLAGCTAVATGDAFACALCGGAISCWGDNRRGTVGNGRVSSVPVGVPQKLAVAPPAGDSWAQLAAGAGYACARTAGGHAYCWGANIHGALGLGAGNASALVPVQRAP
jgi:alpha-tubulin suppressor-like RCC1 family protein